MMTGFASCLRICSVTFIMFMLNILEHAIAEAVNLQLYTVMAWVQSWLRSYGICGGQNDTRVCFL
jgi:hypothetical protein